MRLFLVLIVGASLLASQAAFAQRSADDIDADIAATISNQPLESFIAQFLQPIRQSADGRALTKAEVEAAERRQMVETRAALIGQMLRYDFDGDGALTRQEIEEATQQRRRSQQRRTSADIREQARTRAEAEFRQYAPADADKDGRVTVQEMLASDQLGQRRIERRGASADLLLDLDADGDGKVTTVEAETRARAVFARYDKDGDGLIDDDAIATLSQQANTRRQARQLEESAARCIMPKPSAEELIVLFQAAGGQAVSTLALGSQNETTQVATVTIEQGEKPIYLVLSANRNLIWQVKGAADRVSRAVLLGRESPSPGGRVGLTGIDASKVAFADAAACLGSAAGSDGGERTAKMFDRVLGRSFDISGSAREAILGLSVPALATEGQNMRDMRQADPACWMAMRSVRLEGTGIKMPGQRCNWLEAEQKFLYPGGTIAIDPAKLVSEQSVEAYDILPSPFGYVAAIEDGTLRDISGGAMTQFRVMKPMKRFPATELAARPLFFRLTEGVTLPEGAGRMTCVLGAKGEQLAGRPGRCDQAQ